MRIPHYPSLSPAFFSLASTTSASSPCTHTHTHRALSEVSDQCDTSLAVPSFIRLKKKRSPHMRTRFRTRHDSLSKTILHCTLEAGRCRARQGKCWMDNARKWTSLPMPELLVIASPQKGLEEDLCWILPLPPPPPPPPPPSRRPNRLRDGTELLISTDGVPLAVLNSSKPRFVATHA